MPAQDILIRQISSEAQVDLSRLLKRELTGKDWERVRRTAARLSKYRVQVHDDPNTTVATILMEVQRAAGEGDPYDLVILDYLQLLRAGGEGESSNREQEVSLMSRILKRMARECNVALLVLCQLSRNVEQRANHRPMLSDLRESGGIEQDADVVMFVYRDEYYNKETDQQGIAEIIIGKQRNSLVGTVKLQFHSAQVRFEGVE